MKNLLQKLVGAESTTERGESAAATILRAEFALSGIDAHLDLWDGNRANLSCRVRSTGAAPALLFVCHLDVVPPCEAGWTDPPFAAIEKQGRIYGRGAADMKGGMTAVVTAIRQLIEAEVDLLGDIIFFAAAGEETDSCGAKRLLSGFGKELPALAGVILPEPTDFDVVTAHRGMLWIEVATKGRTAHGSSPELGINAIASMTEFLNELAEHGIPFEPHELLGGCSVSVNTIAGGQAINVVPDACTAGIDIRTLPGQNHADIVDYLEKMSAKLTSRNPQFKAEISVIREMAAMETDPKCDFVRDFCSVVGATRTTPVGFTTDGPHFAALGAPIVVFGPGKPDVCHKPDEYIDLADLERAVRHYKNIILKFLT